MDELNKSTLLIYTSGYWFPLEEKEECLKGGTGKVSGMPVTIYMLIWVLVAQGCSVSENSLSCTLISTFLCFTEIKSILKSMDIK